MKKIMKTLTMLMLLFLTELLASCQTKETPAPGGDTQSALAFAQSLGVGWNLGNNLDSYINGVSVETGWGNPATTQKLFDKLREVGFSSVRIPVTWMGHIGDAPDYRIDKSWLDRVAEVAGYAKNAGLKCIINIHHDGSSADLDPAKEGWFWLDLTSAAKDEEVNNQIKMKLAMVWLQIANRFKNEGEWLIFETFNELHDGKWGNGANRTDGGAQYRTLNEWNQLCVDIIRSTGGENAVRYIGVPGYVCQPGLTVENLVLPEDEIPGRLLVAVHMYDPWDFAGSAKYSEWGHTGVDVVPGSGEKEYNATLDALYNRFVRRGVPVYLGEYGCVHRSTTKSEEFRKYYLEYTCRSLRMHKMPFFVWDNGNRGYGEEAFGLMEHDDGKFIHNGADIIEIMVKAWTSDDSTYTLQSIYERAPRY